MAPFIAIVLFIMGFAGFNTLQQSQTKLIEENQHLKQEIIVMKNTKLAEKKVYKKSKPAVRQVTMLDGIQIKNLGNK